MKRSVGALLLIFMLLGCGTTQMINAGMVYQYDEQTFPYRSVSVPYYELEYCGVVSRVRQHTSWIGARWFGNTFDEWAQFAYLDEQQTTRRINIRMFTVRHYRYLSLDQVHSLVAQLVASIHTDFTEVVTPTRLYSGGRLEDNRFYVDLVYQTGPGQYVRRGLLTPSDWQFAPVSSFTGSCEGYPQESLAK